MFRSIRSAWPTWLLLVVMGSAASAGGPRPGAEGLTPEGRMTIGPADRCPVCAMLPERHPQHAAAIRLKDGRTYYFCSAGCMISAWLEPGAYLGVPADALDRPVASDYFTGRHVDGRDLLWVAGSDVIGPMGPAVVALAARSDVEAFRRRHGGGEPFTLEGLTPESWHRIRSEAPAPR